MRRRLPLLVFILLAIFCLVALGIACACACASDHPRQNIDRALSSIPAATPLVEVWTFTFGTLLILASFGLRKRRVDNSTSPAALQCFLF